MKITEGRVRVSASDVANFLACQQLTQLDLQAARRTLRPPYAVDLGFEDLVRRGEEHERAALERFRADGHEVADLGEAGDPAGATAAAIRDGAAVVYQGTLTGAGGGVTLFGRPDFLVRSDLLPAPDGGPRPGPGPAAGGQRRRDHPVPAAGPGPGRQRRADPEPRAARAARTSRWGPVLRYRGRPPLLRGRPGVRAAVPVRRRRHGRGRRGGTPPVHADLGLRPAGR